MSNELKSVDEVAVTAVDEKRFSITPLSYSNKDRAVAGEIVVDDETGNVWVRNRQSGDLRCATQNVGIQIEDALDSRLGAIDYAVATNRAVYRFYFDQNAIRLDSSLELPDEYVYFQVRDINRASKYYLTELTDVKKTGTSIYPADETGKIADALHHNSTYFVEFYNINFELMSQILFTAKRAPQLSSNGLDKFIDHIEIAVNRDILYLGESIKSLNARVYAVMGDSSYKNATNFSNVTLSAYQVQPKVNTDPIESLTVGAVDITDSNMTAISLDDINTSVEGTYVIKATFMNRLDNDRILEATRTIKVSATEYARLVDNGVAVIPTYYGTTHGEDDIRLRAIAFFVDGSHRDVTSDITFSYSGKLSFDEAGVLDKVIRVTFKEGHAVQGSVNVPLTFYSNDAVGMQSSIKTVLFERNSLDTSGILQLNPQYTPLGGSAFYKVAKVSGKGSATSIKYLTAMYAVNGYDTDYTGSLVDGDQVIVEFYNLNKVLIGVDVLTAKSSTQVI